jgi:hypothetical protein
MDVFFHKKLFCNELPDLDKFGNRKILIKAELAQFFGEKRIQGLQKKRIKNRICLSF